MATDYDAPRRNEADELGEDSLEELKARRAEAQSSSVDVDETDFNENLELPGADLSNEELSVRVLPRASRPGAMGDRAEGSQRRAATESPWQPAQACRRAAEQRTISTRPRTS